MKIIGVIPARYDSTRLPGKPLIKIKGQYLIERVYRQALKSKTLDDIIIATDDRRIEAVCKTFGAKTLMTSRACRTGTDRLAEVARKLNKEAGILINIQGDEPLISPFLIDNIAKAIRSDKGIVMATAAYHIKVKQEIRDPNVVKVVFDKDKNAVYFSRFPIPFNRGYGKTKHYKHIGIYAYRKDFILRFSALKQTPLEKAEKLEQLRALENGYKIKVIISAVDSFGVDIPEDIKKIEKML
ncbi:MAG: 3-deoxy-manno-octulosonate cytidylyltransferase [Elusimicrobia bacterium]|nr:3-deoxy-manno-octulosonate cytidylyltransferase [Candidatus Liberimonas magnetica]